MQRPHVQTVVFDGFPQSLQANAGVIPYILESNPHPFYFQRAKKSDAD